MSITRRSLLAAVVALPFLSLPVKAEHPLRGPIILTISGNISNPTRGPVDAEKDKFFAYNEVEFEQAAEFDFASMQGIGIVNAHADFPMGGGVHNFEGPLLEDVLRVAGAQGTRITIRALDGYAVELDIAEAVANGAIVALKRDGVPFAIGDYGPTHLVFPRADREDLAEMNDDNWVYSIYHIHVE